MYRWTGCCVIIADVHTNEKGKEFGSSTARRCALVSLLLSCRKRKLNAPTATVTLAMLTLLMPQSKIPIRPERTRRTRRIRRSGKVLAALRDEELSEERTCHSITWGASGTTHSHSSPANGTFGPETKHGHGYRNETRTTNHDASLYAVDVRLAIEYFLH